MKLRKSLPKFVPRKMNHIVFDSSPQVPLIDMARFVPHEAVSDPQHPHYVRAGFFTQRPAFKHKEDSFKKILEESEQTRNEDEHSESFEDYLEGEAAFKEYYGKFRHMNRILEKKNKKTPFLDFLG